MGFAEDYIRGRQMGMQAKMQADELEGRKTRRAGEAEILKHTLAKYKADEAMEAVTGPLKIEQMRAQLLSQYVGTGAELSPEQRTMESSVGGGGSITLPSAAESRAAASSAKIGEATQLDALKNVNVDPETAKALNLPVGPTDPEILRSATQRRVSSDSNATQLKAAGIAAKSREATAGKATSKTAFTQTRQLQRDFQADTKDFRGFVTSLAAAKSHAAQGTSAGDQALVQMFIHSLDNSTAREGEVQAFMSAQGIPGKLAKWQGEITGGRQLSDQSRAAVIAAMNGALTAGAAAYTRVKSGYKDRAERFDLNPDDVFSGEGMTGDVGGTAPSRAATHRYNPATGAIEPVQ